MAAISIAPDYVPTTELEERYQKMFSSFNQEMIEGLLEEAPAVITRPGSRLRFNKEYYEERGLKSSLDLVREQQTEWDKEGRRLAALLEERIKRRDPLARFRMLSS